MKSRRMRWTGHVTHIGEKKNAYIILTRKPEGNGLFGRPRRRRQHNIRMDFKEMEEP
jgi:hypothetical protein